MTIRNRNFSNRQPSQSYKGLYRLTTRPCPTCGHTIYSREGTTQPCGVCELLRTTHEQAYTRMDSILGTEPATQRELESMVELFEDGTEASPIIYGGEVLSLCKPSLIGDDEIPF